MLNYPRRLSFSNKPDSIISSSCRPKVGARRRLRREQGAAFEYCGHVDDAQHLRRHAVLCGARGGAASRTCAARISGALGAWRTSCSLARRRNTASFNPMAAMYKVASDGDPVPMLPQGGHSTDAADFVATCSRRDAARRPTAAALLDHPHLATAR
jgi:hypothetical protein